MKLALLNMEQNYDESHKKKRQQIQNRSEILGTSGIMYIYLLKKNLLCSI